MDAGDLTEPESVDLSMGEEEEEILGSTVSPLSEASATLRQPVDAVSPQRVAAVSKVH